MNTQKFKDKLYEILKKDERLFDEGGELNQTLLFDLVDKIDEKVIDLLLQDEDTREKFFSQIKDAYVFKTNDFKFFIDENKIFNSYTQYKNRIGLSDGKEFINNRTEVVLNFPFKDCVLEGGQTTEEGEDTYFQWEDEKLKDKLDENGNKIKDGRKNVKEVDIPAHYEMKKSKRKEIFFNQVLAKDEIDRLLDPKAFVNWKRYTKNGQEAVEEISRNENGQIQENLIIKGNNLLALHSLKSEFSGKIKFIYIDPPYNTGDDSFKYNDRFNHSTWLTFMKNRLEIAKELLSDDGVIAVQSDDNEQAYLKVLMDEVFKKEQFETSFFVQVRYENKTLSEDNDFQKVMEAIHIYSKNHNIFLPNKIEEDYSLDKFKYKINELEKGEIVEINGKKVEIFKENQYSIEEIEPNINGLKETWATGSLIRQGGTAAEFLSKYLIERKDEDGLNVLYKVYNMGSDGLGYRYITGPKKKTATRGKFFSGVPSSLRESIILGEYKKEKPIPNLMYNFLEYQADFGNNRHEGGVNIQGGKKPELLLLYLINYFSNSRDIVLDYHLGSGTTAAVAHKTDRQYIGIEQLDYGENDSVVRLKNVIKGDTTGISNEVAWKGGGDFIYVELAKWNEVAKENINNATSLQELEELFDDMYEKYFLNYNLKVKEFKEKVIKEEEFIKLSLDEQKRMFLTMLDLNQMYVPASEIEDKKYDISEEDQKLTKMFYGEI